MGACRFPNVPIWVTEYGLANEEPEATQLFFNKSLAYFDKADIIQRYSMFGAFRSSVSNVGPHGAMLDPYGNLTDIGSWYLGGNATGTDAVPAPYKAPDGTSCSADKPCGSKSAAGRYAMNGGWLQMCLFSGLISSALTAYIL